ncbi:reverse transcriptase, partial [Globisporangium splendens]
MRLYWPRFETRDRADSIGSNASTVSSSQGSLGSDAGFLLDSDEDSDVEDDLDNDEDHHHHHAHEDPPPPPPPQTRATVTEVHPHRGPHYVCTLCGFSAPHMFVLGRHRALAHENDHFVDIFTCECACDRHFTTRGAAANHERGCSTAQNTTTLGLAPQNDGPDPETAAPSSIPEPGPPPTTMSPPATVPERTSTCTSTVGYQTEGAKRRRLAPPLPMTNVSNVPVVPPSRRRVPHRPLTAQPLLYRVHHTTTAAHQSPLRDDTTTTHTQASRFFPAPDRKIRIYENEPEHLRRRRNARGGVNRQFRAQIEHPSGPDQLVFDEKLTVLMRQLRFGANATRDQASGASPGPVSLSHENATPVPENALARPTTARNSSLGPRNAISVGESANARTITAPSSSLSHENAPPVPENALARPTTARNSSLGPRNAILEAASTAMRTRTQGERTLTANPLNWRPRAHDNDPSITPEAKPDYWPAMEPGGSILWTCHHFLPENFNTNNTAEYTALLDGVQAAKRHGARRLRVEGDSILVIRQVRGIYACGNKRLRALRNRILGCLRSLDSFELHHIDRKANTQADALANRALDHAATKSVCAVHGAGDDRCWTPIQRKTTSQRPDPEATVDEEMKETSDDDEEVVRRDEGEVYAPVRLEPGTIPAKRPRLQLRALSENEDEKSRAIIERFAKKMATKITYCEDWETGEGYITALTMQMYDLLQEYSTTKKPRSMMKTKKKTTATKTMMRPPRPSTQHREARLEEALDDLIIAQRAEPSQQGRIQKARRRVGRVKVAILRSKLRLKFEQKEKECVQELLRGVNEDVTEGPMEDTTCPIGREDLYAFFQGVNTPNMVFDFDSDVGAPFRAVLQRLPPPEQVREALTDDLTIDEIEDQLQIVNGASSPGLDGIGHDVYKHFRLQLLTALHAAFSFCWKHKKVPTAWKVGTVRLLYKKGDPNQPSNWRPICLQQCIYKLYSGILAKRFTRWMDTNERFSLAQKGFRAFNGCHEHNFLSTSLLDQTRRMHRKLYNVWYDLKNAFGSLPQELMWRVLGMLRVDAAFIERAQNIYEDSHFVVNNAHDGPTDPIRQEIGVYQGCPLSPYLFIAALIPLLRGLQELPGVGVPLAENFRPCVSAYADDIKIFSDSASGIRSAHQLVDAS